MDVTRFLAGKGILVSAGHCNPNLEQLDAAIEAGLSMFTHLGNGCPMLLARHDNIIQRALSRSDRLTVMFIGDNVHVSYIALGNYLRIVGPSRDRGDRLHRSRRVAPRPLYTRFASRRGGERRRRLGTRPLPPLRFDDQHAADDGETGRRARA